MKIAQVAPLDESTPPKTYGGIERIVACLTDELTEQGHDVTLFATADSTARATRLIPCAESGLRQAKAPDPVARHLAMLETVAEMSDEFEVIHFHLDHLHMPLARAKRWPHLTTLHGRLDLEDREALYRGHTDLPVVSISNAQRRPIPGMNWQATVYNGLPRDSRKFSGERGDYLAFVGRISPEKGLHRAISIARQAGLPLRIAAKIDDRFRDYYEAQIQPELGKSGIEFLGEIAGGEKDAFLRGARALLFPISWPEPFGLVMIEAMACGAPVIAFPEGAVPEVIEDGVTGFLVDSVESAVDAVGRLEAIDRAACRSRFETLFSAERMAEEYLRVYRRIANGSRGRSPNLNNPRSASG